MCTPSSDAHTSTRYGSQLDHGQAHGTDHRRWSRRDFLRGLGVAMAAPSFLLQGTPVQAFGTAPLMAHLNALENNRTLILIQLNGGNDGLNTIVPINNDIYYNQRPDLALAPSDTIRIQDDLGMHSAFSTLEPRFKEGEMAILQNVGYPSPDLSHFRSTDIWASASDADVVDNTGWLGRYLDTSFPDFTDNPPPAPLAVQIGGGTPLLFQGPNANMGMSLINVDFFDRIAATGLVYDVADLPDTAFGNEMKFVRSVANASFKYAGAIQEAAGKATNKVPYPSGNPLAANLAVLAKLIKGDLGARFYQVSLGSFDTHAGQLPDHARLLRYLAEGVSAFLADLQADGREQEVLVMTFSEFGRRVNQNGSGGTDHGTAAPLFLFGNGLNGGLYGSTPDLTNLDPGNNLIHDLDFRQVYTTLLQDWFGLSQDVTSGLLNGPFEPLSFIQDPINVANEPEPIPDAFLLAQNYPNPFNPKTTITYRLEQSSTVSLSVYDVQGRAVRQLVSSDQPAGSYTVSFDAESLPSGTYLYRLQTEHGVQSRKMTLVR